MFAIIKSINNTNINSLEDLVKLSEKPLFFLVKNIIMLLLLIIMACTLLNINENYNIDKNFKKI